MKKESAHTQGLKWLELALDCNEREEYDQAIEYGRKTLKLRRFPLRGLAWYCLAMAHTGEEQYERALTCYRRALKAGNLPYPGDA